MRKNKFINAIHYIILGILILIIIMPIIMLAFVFFIYNYAYSVDKVSDKVMFLYNWEKYYENSPNEIADYPLFSSVEGANEFYYRNENDEPAIKKEEIFRNNQGEYILTVYAEDKNIISSFLYLQQGDKISYPIQQWDNWLPIIPELFDSSYREKRYTEEDWAASHIVQTILAPYYSDLTGFENFYYGFGTKKITQNLTILGYAPTEVIPYKCEGKTYYFWYYDYSVPFAKVLKENLDTTEFTLADVIDCMDISFD